MRPRPAKRSCDRAAREPQRRCSDACWSSAAQVVEVYIDLAANGVERADEITDADLELQWSGGSGTSVDYDHKGSVRLNVRDSHALVLEPLFGTPAVVLNTHPRVRTPHKLQRSFVISKSTISFARTRFNWTAARPPVAHVAGTITKCVIKRSKSKPHKVKLRLTKGEKKTWEKLMAVRKPWTSWS